MAVQQDFILAKYEDGTLTISMIPPTPIGGMSIEFVAQKHFGGETKLIQKYIASGLNGQSGITVTNSGMGVFNVQIDSVDSSGLNFGNIAYAANRTNSGMFAALTEGYIILTPNTGQ